MLSALAALAVGAHAPHKLQATRMLHSREGRGVLAQCKRSAHENMCTHTLSLSLSVMSLSLFKEY